MINNFKRGDWTDGLSSMPANALKSHGFKSRKQVIDAFNKGLIYIKQKTTLRYPLKEWAFLRVEKILG